MKICASCNGKLEYKERLINITKDHIIPFELLSCGECGEFYLDSDDFENINKIRERCLDEIRSKYGI